MSTTNEELRVKLLDAKKAETELRKVRNELEETSGQTGAHARRSHEQAKGVEHVSKSFGKLRTVLSYGASLTGLGAVGYGLKDIVQGGIRAQEQQVLLRGALKATGKTGSKHLGEINDALDRNSSRGGFGVVEESQGIQQLIRISGNYRTALRLDKAAVQLARGTHLGYATAIKIVSQAQTGNTGRLQKYLGIIQPVTSHVDALKKQTKEGNEATKEQIELYRVAHPGVKVIGSAMAEVNKKALEHAKLLDKEATALRAQEAIQKKYGNSVVYYNKTAAGAISNANNAFKDATEELGQKLLPTVTKLAIGFGHLIESIQHGRGAWGTLGKDITKVWHDLEGIDHFLQRHKSLTHLLEFAAGGSVAAKLAKKAPGVGLASKLLKAGASPEGAAAEGSAASKVSAVKLAYRAGQFARYGGPAALGAAFVPASAAAIRTGVEALSPGYLKQRSLGEVQRLLATGSAKPLQNLGYGNTRLGGIAARGKESPAEASLVSRLLEHPNLITSSSFSALNAQERGRLQGAYQRAEAEHVHITIPVNLDGKQIAELVGDHAIRTPKVARKLAEATTKHVLAKKSHG